MLQKALHPTTKLIQISINLNKVSGVGMIAVDSKAEFN